MSELEIDGFLNDLHDDPPPPDYADDPPPPDYADDIPATGDADINLTQPEPDEEAIIETVDLPGVGVIEVEYEPNGDPNQPLDCVKPFDPHKWVNDSEHSAAPKKLSKVTSVKNRLKLVDESAETAQQKPTSRKVTAFMLTFASLVETFQGQKKSTDLPREDLWKLVVSFVLMGLAALTTDIIAGGVWREPCYPDRLKPLGRLHDHVIIALMISGTPGVCFEALRRKLAKEELLAYVMIPSDKKSILQLDQDPLHVNHHLLQDYMDTKKWKRIRQRHKPNKLHVKDVCLNNKCYNRLQLVALAEKFRSHHVDQLMQFIEENYDTDDKLSSQIKTWWARFANVDKRLQVMVEHGLDSFNVPEKSLQLVMDWLNGGYKKRTLILSGPPGAGKTSLMKALLLEHSRKYLPPGYHGFYMAKKSFDRLKGEPLITFPDEDQPGREKFLLLMDEFDVKSIRKCDAPNDIKGLLDVEEANEQDVKCREDVQIPKGGIRVITTNCTTLKAYCSPVMDNVSWEWDERKKNTLTGEMGDWANDHVGAIIRRCEWVRISENLKKNPATTKMDKEIADLEMQLKELEQNPSKMFVIIEMARKALTEKKKIRLSM